MSTCHMQMTCLSNKVFFFFGGAPFTGGVTRLKTWFACPGNNACEVVQLCVCAIFTLFQYHAYVKLWLCMLVGGRGGVGLGMGAWGFRVGARFGLSVLSVRFLVSVFRLWHFQVCTSNVWILNFSWLPQKCRSVCVYVRFPDVWVCVYACLCIFAHLCE